MSSGLRSNSFTTCYVRECFCLVNPDSASLGMECAPVFTGVGVLLTHPVSCCRGEYVTHAASVVIFYPHGHSHSSEQ